MECQSDKWLPKKLQRSLMFIHLLVNELLKMTFGNVAVCPGQKLFGFGLRRVRIKPVDAIGIEPNPREQ